LLKVSNEHLIIETKCSFSDPCKPARVIYERVTVTSSSDSSDADGILGGGGTWWKVIASIAGVALLVVIVIVFKKKVYDKSFGGYNNFRRRGWHSRNSMSTRELGGFSGAAPETFSPFGIGGGDEEDGGVELADLYMGTGGDSDGRNDGVTKLEEEFDGSVGYQPPSVGVHAGAISVKTDEGAMASL